MKDKFIEVNTWYEPTKLLELLSQGYEIVTQYTVPTDLHGNLNGYIMNNTFTIENFPRSIQTTTFVLKQPPAAQVLYGKQDNTGN